MSDSEDNNPPESGSDAATPNRTPGVPQPDEPATVALTKVDARTPSTPEPPTVALKKVDAPKPSTAETTPDAATVAIPEVVPPVETQPAATKPAAPQRAAPQRVGVPSAGRNAAVAPTPTRIEPAQPAQKKSGKGWYIAAGVAGVAVLAAIGGAVVVSKNGDAKATPQAEVQTAITTFVNALDSGDLPTLRSSTCGALADYYRTIPDDAFAQVHDNAVAQQTIPRVGAVDAIQITGETAIAQVQATLPSTSEQSWRTFDLERQDGTWRVCDR